jgi:hypothetical protein
VRGIHDALMRLRAASVAGDDLVAVEDHDLVVADEHLHGATDESVRDAVANRVDIDEAVGGNDPRFSPLPHGLRACRQRTERRGIVALEVQLWRLVRGAVDGLVGILHPAFEVRFER